MNRILKASFILVLVVAVLAEEPNAGGGPKPRKTSADFAKHLDGPARWNLGSVGTLTLKMDGESTLFVLNENQEVFRLNAPEYITQAVPSEDGKSLILIAMRNLGFGSNFSSLVQIQPEAGKLKVRRALEVGQKLFEGRRWAVSELGAVSNDGTRVLAKIAVWGPSRGPLGGYRWYTVELASGKILGEGLTMENGKKP